MKKIFIVLFLSSISIANAVTVFDFPAIETDRSIIQESVSRNAFVYGVSESLMFKVIACESSHNKNAVNINKWEKSYGLVQINLPQHPEVSEEQARDIEFSIRFLAKGIKEGRARQWTCAR